MSRNKGGRHKKEVKKSRRAELRLTEAEFEKLIQLEEETGVNRSSLFIKRVLENQDFIITKDVLIQLAKVGAEMGKVGNNINQLAKHSNTIIKNHQLPPEIVSQYNDLLELHLVQERELYKVLRQMYRVMKN
jgi:cation transport regulator ChaC